MSFNLLRHCVWCTGTGTFAKGEKCHFCKGKGQVIGEVIEEFPSGSLRVQLGDEFLYVKRTDALVPFLLTSGLSYTVWSSKHKSWRALSDSDALDEEYVEAIEGFMLEEDQNRKGSV